VTVPMFQGCNVGCIRGRGSSRRSEDQPGPPARTGWAFAQLSLAEEQGLLKASSEGRRPDGSADSTLPLGSERQFSRTIERRWRTGFGRSCLNPALLVSPVAGGVRRRRRLKLLHEPAAFLRFTPCLSDDALDNHGRGQDGSNRKSPPCRP